MDSDLHVVTKTNGQWPEVIVWKKKISRSRVGGGGGGGGEGEEALAAFARGGEKNLGKRQKVKNLVLFASRLRFLFAFNAFVSLEFRKKEGLSVFGIRF